MSNKKNIHSKDFLDGALFDYFSKRTSVPPKLRDQAMAQLQETQGQAAEIYPHPSRWIWSIAVYDLLISSAFLFIQWILLGQSIIVYVTASFVAFSLLAVVVITFVSHLLAAPDKHGLAPGSVP
jgi:hypothetical protein